MRFRKGNPRAYGFRSVPRENPLKDAVKTGDDITWHFKNTNERIDRIEGKVDAVQESQTELELMLETMMTQLQLLMVELGTPEQRIMTVMTEARSKAEARRQARTPKEETSAGLRIVKQG